MKKLFFTSFLVLFFINGFAQIKVACVGNSITYGAGIEGRDSLAYPPQLEKILGADWAVANFGHSGATLLKNGNKPYWNLPEFDSAKSFQPDVVIIMLGTNDSKPINWVDYQAEFESDYIKMIQEFKSLPSKPVVFICRPIPVFGSAWTIDENVVANEIPPKIKNISKKEKVKVINLYKPLQNRPDLVPDKVHPDAEGSAIMAKEIARVLIKSKKKF